MSSVKLESITLRRGCFPLNLLPHVSRTPFPKNTSGGLLLFRTLSSFISEKLLESAIKETVHFIFSNLKLITIANAKRTVIHFYRTSCQHCAWGPNNSAWSNRFCIFFRKGFDFVLVCLCLDVLSNKTNFDLLLIIHHSSLTWIKVISYRRFWPIKIPENTEVKGIFTRKPVYSLLWANSTFLNYIQHLTNYRTRRSHCKIKTQWKMHKHYTSGVSN